RPQCRPRSADQLARPELAQHVPKMARARDLADPVSNFLIGQRPRIRLNELLQNLRCAFRQPREPPGVELAARGQALVRSQSRKARVRNAEGRALALDVARG